jgi:SAM-dependent methyltransferase
MSSAHEEADRPLGIVTDAEEIAHYSEVATLPDKCRGLRSAVERVRDLQTSWAVPLVYWLDTVPDCAAQADVYIHLSASIVGGRVLQIGGTGQAALKALAGGATSAVLVTPSAGEADLAGQVASELGFSDRFATAVGFAESLPVDGESVTAVISEGCMHHTNTTEAFRECSRVLVPGGRFGAWDPWKARLYTLGISIFGKRDPDVNCRPMDSVRLADLPTIFPTRSEVRLHGAITRYPGIAWSRYVNAPKVSTSYRMTTFDDRISKYFPALARNGSSCAILAVK